MEKNSKNKVEVFPEKNVFKPLDFFVIRTPLFPVSHYYSLGQIEGQPSIEKLLKGDAKVETALAVGNASFYEAIKKAAEEEQSGAQAKQKPAKDGEKIHGKVLRVLTRMATRSTPFGLYAGVGVGKWSDKSDLSLNEIGKKSRTRLDMELVTKAALGLETEMLPSLHLISNPTLRQFSGRLYLLEKAPVLDEKDVDGSWIEATEEVIGIVEMTQTPIAYSKLLTEISDKFNMYEDDTQALIEYLVENTYLLTSIRPNTFDASAGEDLLAIIKDTKSESSIKLAEVLNELAAMNKSGEISSEGYLELSRKARKIFEVEVTSASLQTDMALSLKGNSLKSNLAADLAKYVDLLIRLSPSRPTSSPLRVYKERFQEKYERREVPILELLNQDFGLGFPQYGAAWSFEMEEYKRQIILDEFIQEALLDRKIEVELNAETMAKMLVDSKDFRYPLSTDMFFNLVANSLEDIDNGNYLLVGGSVLSGAGRNLGRFADMIGEEAISALKHVGTAESEVVPDCMMAELSSLPRSFRLGNVCTIPLAKPYRLVLDSWSGVNADNGESRSLDLNDLLVGLDDVTQTFYLRSAKSGAKVIVTAPSLMNSLFKTQIARFLSSIADDAVSFAGQLRWGTASDANFKPRLRFGKFVISTAQWSVRLDAGKRDEFASPQKFKAWLAEWRKRWMVPRYVQLKEYDNLLLLDLDNEMQSEEFRRELCSTKSNILTLQEAFFAPEQLWLDGTDGKHASEIVASFVMAQKPAAAEKSVAAKESNPNQISHIERVRCPGNEWIYFKLYSGKSLQDDLLAANISEFVEGLKSDKLIESWFFIRYEDNNGGPHLRVRVKGDPAVLQKDVSPRVNAFCNALVNEGLCTTFVIDAYSKEIERYGGLKAIGLAEEWFSIDSELVTRLIALESQEGWAFDRGLIAAYASDRILEALGLDLKEKSRWYKTNSNRNLHGDEFRKEKDALHFLFTNGYGNIPIPDSEPLQQALFSNLAQWSARLKEVGKKYLELRERNDYEGNFDYLCSSFVHMHCNRYLGVDHPAEAKARTMACRAHEARANRKENSQEGELVKAAKSN